MDDGYPEAADATNGYALGRLAFRPRASTGTRRARDEPLGLSAERDGVLYVPETAEPGAPPLVFLHGAGGTGRRVLRAALSAADRYGFLEQEQKMPAFGPDQLAPNDLEMVIRYLKGDYAKPPGNTP